MTGIFSSLGEMLAGCRLDAVHVLLPPELHATAASEVIAARLPVFLEKPMAVAADECDGLIESARHADVKVGVGHNFLFSPVYEQLKTDLAAGRLGRPDEVTITWNKPLGQLQSGPFNLWMLREPGNIMLEVGPHSVAHMLDLVGPVEILATRCTNPVDLPGGARFFRRWRVEANTGPVAVSLNFSFAPGFSEHTIHVRGSLAAATVDFERNTYLLHRHTPSGTDVDRYHMTVSDARALKRQARTTLGEVIYSKIRPTGGPPYGRSIARALQSFYASHSHSLDARLSPELGRDVVRTCVEIGRLATGPLTARAAPVRGPRPEANGVSRGPAAGVHGDRPEVLVLGATGFIGQELARAPGPGPFDPAAGAQPRPPAPGPAIAPGRRGRGRPLPGL